MRRLVLLAAFTSLVSVAAADPVITSISPIEGPVSGGTVVTIRGTGFSDTCIICSPPFADPLVYFDNTPAASVKFIDSTTIEAVTPPHLPHEASITVRQHDGSENPGKLSNAFRYMGDPETAFEPILFPVFRPPVDGAYGSRFETTARVSNRTSMPEVRLYGLDTTCDPAIVPATGPFDLVGMDPSRVLPPGCATSTGRLFYLLKGGRLTANLRVRDLSRQASSHGVEVPVVKGDDFTQDRLEFLGIPVDPRFRLTLRIYSLKRGVDVFPNVQINGVGVGQVHVTPGRTLFEPGYGVFTDFPQDLPPGSTMYVEVFMGKLPDGSIHPDTARIWAMITVTNNETQEITTITPQP